MPLNPQAEQLLALFEKHSGGMDMSSMTPEEARKVRSVPQSINIIPVAQVAEHSIECGDRNIAVRRYVPEGPGPFPLMVYFHGGGWVIGDLDSHDNLCRALCVESKSVVVSVDYRLAPECKFPGPFDDCFDATVWAYEHAAEFNADPNRIIIAGDSAGGNLAAAVALKSRDLIAQGNQAPLIAMQLLLYPVTNFSFDTDSYHENATGLLLTTDTMRWFWNHYLENDLQGSDPYASPLQSLSLKGLPDAIIVTAEFDPLRDEAEDYAQQLMSSGNRVDLIRYSGQIHGFISLFEMLDDGRRAIATVGGKLIESLSQK